MTTLDPKIEALIARAREFVAAPNVHFHYKDGAEVMAGLADALSSLPAQAVGVRALEWRGTIDHFEADSILGRYSIKHDGDEPDEWSISLGGPLWRFASTEDAAKAIAEDHLKRTILFALAPSQPAAVGERADALWEQLLPFMQVEECPPGDPYKDKVAALALIEAALRSTP